MPSPFPGMDPYLEAHWGDVHATLIVYSREQLQSRLPSDLRARVEERVFLQSDDDAPGRSIYPDVRVYERPRPRRETLASGNTATAEVAVAEPLVVHKKHEPVTETFIEIREAGSGGRVITVIEFVSMSNKQPGDGRKLYLEKQQELRAAGVNSVEIDLLRAGESVVGVPPEMVPADYRKPYRLSVWRACHPDQWEVYRAPLEQRLPAIAIPLRESDKDVPLDLQPLIDRCYTSGGYDDIDYTQPARPPLDAEAAEWAREHVLGTEPRE